MKFLVNLAAMALVVVLHGCGGGQSIAGPAANIVKPVQSESASFVVEYFLPDPVAVPGGAIRVMPPDGQMTIGPKPVAKVELLVFGYDTQVLTSPNSQPKDNPQLRYLFTLPSTFTTGAYPCGTGAYLSEVRVTDVTGSTVSKTFELCPGTPLVTSAAGQ